MPKINPYYKRQTTRLTKCEYLGCNKWPLYYSVRNDKWLCYLHKKIEERNLNGKENKAT